MTQYYFIYHKQFNMFLSHSGKYEYTQEEANKMYEKYSNDETLCPTKNVNDVLKLIETEEVMNMITNIQISAEKPKLSNALCITL